MTLKLFTHLKFLEYFPKLFNQNWSTNLPIDDTLYISVSLKSLFNISQRLCLCINALACIRRQNIPLYKSFTCKENVQEIPSKGVWKVLFNLYCIAKASKKWFYRSEYTSCKIFCLPHWNLRSLEWVSRDGV